MLTIITIIITVLVTSFFFILNYSLIKKNNKKIQSSTNNEPQKSSEIKDTEKYLNKRPNDIFAILRLSYLYFQQKDFIQSLSNLNVFLRSDLSAIRSLEIQALILAADCSLKLNQNDNSESYLQKAFKIDPTYIEVLQRIIKFKYEKNDFDAVANISRKIMTLNPERFEGPYYFGMASYQKDECEIAAKYLKEATSIIPSHFRANFTIGMIHSKMNNNKEALISFENVQKLAKSEAEKTEVMYQKASLLKKQNKSDEASLNYKQVLKASPAEEIRLLSLRAIIDIEKENKNINKTIFYLTEYLKLKPDDIAYNDELAYYKELASHKLFQDIEIKDGTSFFNTCVSITKKLLPEFDISQSNLKDESSVEIIGTEKIKGGEKKRIIWYMRSKNIIGIIPATDLYARMSEFSAQECVLVSNSTYNQEAINFAKMRMIELIDKQGLIKLLNKIIEKKPSQNTTNKNIDDNN